MKALIIPADDAPRVEDITPGLSTFQELVGGYIEAAPTEGDVTVFVNEEGKLIGLPPNIPATFFWWALAPFMKGNSVLNGTAVILGPPDSDGNTTDVPEHVIALFHSERWFPGSLD